MSGVTDNYSFILPADGESYDVAIPNGNFTEVDRQIKETYKHKQARYNMIAAKTGLPAGNGQVFGPLQIDSTKPNYTKNNDFSVAENSGSGANDTGKIKILVSGYYDIHSMILPAGPTANINYALIVGGEKLATMNRTSTYGDWEAVITVTGAYIAANQYIEGYMANGSGLDWGNWVIVKQVAVA